MKLSDPYWTGIGVLVAIISLILSIFIWVSNLTSKSEQNAANNIQIYSEKNTISKSNKNVRNTYTDGSIQQFTSENNTTSKLNGDNQSNSIQQNSLENEVNSLPKNNAQRMVGIMPPEIEQEFNSYINAMNYKDYNQIVTLLSNDFYYVDQTKRLNLEEYLNNKRKLFSQNAKITVKVSNIEYSLKGDSVVVSYFQYFNSPYYEIEGRNELFFKNNKGKMEIFIEQFSRGKFRVKQGGSIDEI